MGRRRVDGGTERGGRRGSAWQRWRQAFLRREAEAELAEELAFHLDMEAEENRRRGLSPEEARRRARIDLGGVARTQEAAREVWSFGRVEDWWRELRVVLRGLWRDPRYGLLVVVTLGLAIGASTALFAAFRQVVLPPLPYDGAERVVTLWETDAASPGRLEVSPANWLDWRERNRTFSHLGLAQGHGVDVTDADGRPVAHGAWLVSDGFFESLGARPTVGRLFTSDDFDPETERRVVLSHGYWQRRYGGDTDVVGSRILLDSEPVTVVGVLAAGVAYPWDEDFYFPMAIAEYFRRIRVGNWMYAVGRLREGVSVEAARQDLAAIAAELAAENPKTNDGLGVALVPLERQVLGETRSMLSLLFGAVCLLFLVSCATIASLVVARSFERGHEGRIRRALGAERRDLLRRSLVESLALAGTAGLVGFAIASAALRLLVLAATAGLARMDDLDLDLPTLGFGILMSGLAVTLAGILPAAYTSRRTAGLASRGQRSTPAGGLLRLHRALTVAQIAVALVLLIASGLLVRSFGHLLATDLGFQPAGVSTLQVHLWDSYPDRRQRADFVDRAVERFAALPGVASVAASSAPPFHPEAIATREEFEEPAAPPPPPGELRIASIDVVTPGFFETLGIPVLQGRGFAAGDRADSPRVMVVSETLASAVWPAGDAVGRRLLIGVRSQPLEWEVVGVVGDVRTVDHATRPRPAAYFPHRQVGEGSMTFLLRGDDGAPLQAAVTALGEMAPGLSVAHLGRLDEMVETALAPHRFYLLLLGVFAGVALLLALSGTYGLVSFTTSRRTAEFGIRRVVGARDSDLTRLVLRETGGLIVLGLVLGVAGALGLTRFLHRLLHGVTPTDPLTFATLGALLGAVALTAAWLPAHRVARREPMDSLRSL